MTYNFDKIIERRGTNSLKYDFAVERGMPAEVLPLWVADMDFRAPEPVLADLQARVMHGIFGYTDSKESYFTAARDWFASHFNYVAEPAWLVKTPGVVFALALAVRAFSEVGDAVLIQEPVYYPFGAVIRANRRQVAVNELLYHDGNYTIDFVDFEQKISTQKIKLFIFCSPHNPVGRVWTLEEIIRLGEICEQYNCVVISDEIHCDFVWSGKHTVFAAARSGFADFSVICTAPSKSFNLAGLQAANIFIANENLRQRFRREVEISGYSQLNTLGLTASESAYKYGAEWLAELKIYLAANFDFMREFLARELPAVKMSPTEGTYLAWLDCRGLGFTDRELNERIIRRAKLWLDDGAIFGEAGRGFQRFNIACPRRVLTEALQRFCAALQK